MAWLGVIWPTVVWCAAVVSACHFAGRGLSWCSFCGVRGVVGVTIMIWCDVEIMVWWSWYRCGLLWRSWSCCGIACHGNCVTGVEYWWKLINHQLICLTLNICYGSWSNDILHSLISLTIKIKPQCRILLIPAYDTKSHIGHTQSHSQNKDQTLRSW